MLFSRRKRLEALAREEAAGADFWSEEFDLPSRNKIVHAFRDASGEYLEHYSDYARDLILRDEGAQYLHAASVPSAYDLLNYTLNCSDDMVPTVVEAMVQALTKLAPGYISYIRCPEAAGFVETVQVILREHRISFDLDNGQMVEFSSKEMHEAVVAPTLRLLAGRRDLDRAESAYRDALEEISRGKPGDAITDAGTALQETLVALGCSGNALGPLIKSAKTSGLLAPHDSPLFDSIEKAFQWASADRSQTGDAHMATAATPEDAWLMVHVVGALMLRLTQGAPRGGRA